jgi:glycosyltransferase involved in cell wall biosynthesis
MRSEGDLRPEVAAIVLTKDEERHIGACLDSLAWADRRIVFDSFSTDRTCDFARERGAQVIQYPFGDYASQRNAAMDAVEAEWILFVDADERATPELAEEIRLVTHTPGPHPPSPSPTGSGGDGWGAVTGWNVPRDNYLFGHLTRGAGYWPDYQMRLLRCGHARYERPASEIVVMDGETGYLKNPLIHYNYESVAQFHAKQRFRIDFEATNLYRQGIKPRFYTPYRQCVRHFWWRYVTLKGYIDGLHGLRLSFLLAYYFGYRYYRRLAQMWRQAN